MGDTRFTRMYADADGDTHFEDVPLKMGPAVAAQDTPMVDVAVPVDVTGLIFTRMEPGFTSDWHPAPRRQFVIVLSGGLELTGGDGETRHFGPGGVFLAEDTGGKGHQARTTGDSGCLVVMVPCAPTMP